MGLGEKTRGKTRETGRKYLKNDPFFAPFLFALLTKTGVGMAVGCMVLWLHGYMDAWVNGYIVISHYSLVIVSIFVSLSFLLVIIAPHQLLDSHHLFY
jgi:uncharacterized membrane protein SpoIIM required for sporulation